MICAVRRLAVRGRATVVLVAVTGLALCTGAGAQSDLSFEDIAITSGLDFVHFNGMSGAHYFPEMMGAGVALLDYDLDGDMDVYLVQGHMLGAGKTIDDALFKPHHDLPLIDRLYRNDCPRDKACNTPVFTDITEQSGLHADGYGMGVASADIDNDGYPDLYVMNFGSNQMWRNRGDGTFEDITEQSGTDDPRWSVSASFVDIDNDGQLDLYVGNYLKHDNSKQRVCKLAKRFDDYCGPLRGAGQTDRLFRNLGGGRFSDISEASGITTAHGGALGISVADFNGDGWRDIYVANDGVANRLWINQGDRTFSDEALLGGVSVNKDGMAEASMGVDAADFDGDGDIDLFMTHLRQETNTLYVNDGNGWFEDRSVTMGVAGASFGYTGFGTAWFDANNDGWLDILSVNGAVRKIETLLLADDPYPLHQINQIFLNAGGGRYREITAQAGEVFDLSEVSRGAAFGDIDNDGDTDVLVANNNGPVRLLRNDYSGPNLWLGLRLVNHDGRDALGAVVSVPRRDQPTLVRQIRSDGSYASANDPRVVVGLGRHASEHIDVTVTWPDGESTQHDRLAVNRYHELRP